MNCLGIINKCRRTAAEVIAVIKLGENPYSDVVCKDKETGSEFTLDPYVGAENETILKVGDTFEAIVHPVQVVFAVSEWIRRP